MNQTCKPTQNPDQDNSAKLEGNSERRRKELGKEHPTPTPKKRRKKAVQLHLRSHVRSQCSFGWQHLKPPGSNSIGIARAAISMNTENTGAPVDWLTGTHSEPCKSNCSCPWSLLYRPSSCR